MFSCSGNDDDNVIEQDSNNDASFSGSGFTLNSLAGEGKNSYGSWTWFKQLTGGVQKYCGKVGTYNKIVITLYDKDITYNESADTFTGDGTYITFALWVSKGNTVVRSGTYSALDTTDKSMTKWHFSINGSTNTFLMNSSQQYPMKSGTIRITQSGSSYILDFVGTTESGLSLKLYYSGALKYVD
jgi:hypothetical protein